ncbi:aldehyde dehydrogenase family protein [Halobacillus shinanisalinarum]|uniref:Aldehyde dehydrogenase family protein n=1 Tax=Halobacillus shinanisalinarum TaxID=2932258 RepID=A0ABY4GW45_9BACI|nr:aldehyde dehydrogenase family protein [Halobacillus shinanisalinarum]UOQ92284.1 aldehyde dehydrogenase family protein [Halobacillus shinanisalinarum]
MDNLLMYVDGEWKASLSGKTIEFLDPSNQQPLGTIPRGEKVDVDTAVSAARKAFESELWRTIKPHERGYILTEMANKIRFNKDELANLETLDVGKPLSQAYSDVEAAARYFEFYAGAADKIMGETIPIEDGIIDFTVRDPIGVTAHIIPWNYPIQISSRSTAAAIATGNTVVLKTAEDTSLTALKLAEYFHETNLPRGVFNVITGLGHEAGAALSTHPDVNHITFTGSVATGKQIMKSAAENIVPVTLELGGKSPNIVFADCNEEEALNGVVRSIIQNAGQTCSAGSRLLIEDNYKDRFLSLLKEKFKKVTIGPGKDDYDLGPILSKNQFDKVSSFIEKAREEGEVITGGERVNIKGFEDGYYLQPTIIDHISHESDIAQQEIFGPVLSVFPFEDEQKAVELANGTDYGLVTGIWTENIGKAHRIADKVLAGQLFINNYGAGGGIQMPFGGYKRSGFGREKGLIALKNYTQLKNVAIKYK